MLHKLRKYYELLRQNEWIGPVVILGVGLAAAQKIIPWGTTQINLTLNGQNDAALQMLQNKAQDFITLMLGIFVEAFPFVVLGALLSAFIQVFVPAHAIVKRLPRNFVARRLLMSFVGILMPVCECGNVPVARSLIARGVSPGDAMIFLLSAPSINIITFVATWEAFNTDHSMAWLRVALTIVVANITAHIMVRFHGKRMLTDEFVKACSIDHTPRRNLSSLSTRFSTELWLITRLLAVGAMIAAASQIFISRDVITSIASEPVTAVAAMLALAFVISICSSVDAFFALAFTGTFPPGAILAFLVAGPMVDIKMVALLRSTLRSKAILTLCLTVLSLTFVMGVSLVYLRG